MKPTETLSAGQLTFENVLPLASFPAPYSVTDPFKQMLSYYIQHLRTSKLSLSMIYFYPLAIAKFGVHSGFARSGNLSESRVHHVNAFISHILKCNMKVKLLMSPAAGSVSGLICGGEKERKKELLTKTRNGYYGALKHFFGWAVKNSYVHEDPTASVKFIRTLPTIPNILSLADYNRIMDHLVNDTELACIVTIFCEGGLRTSEFLRLTLKDVRITDPDRPTIQVRKMEGDAEKKNRTAIMPSWFTPKYMRFLAEKGFSMETTASNTALFDYSVAELHIRLKSLKKPPLGFTDEVTPTAFRYFCGRKLRHNGWTQAKVNEYLGLQEPKVSPATTSVFEELAALPA